MTWQTEGKAVVYVITCNDCGDRIRIDSRDLGKKQTCQCAGVTWYAQPFERVASFAPEVATIEREQTEGKADDAG